MALRLILPALALLFVVLLFARKLHLLKRKQAEERQHREGSAAMVGRLREDMENLDKERKLPKS